MRFTALVCFTSLLAGAASACPRPAKPCGPVVVYEQCRPQPRWCHWFQRPEQIDRVVEKQSAEPAKAATVAKDSPEVKWTTIRGRIIWDKAVRPAPMRVPIKPTRDKQVALMDGDFYTEDWVVNPDNLGIKYAVVWLAPEPIGQEITKLQQAMSDRKTFIFRSFRPEQLHSSVRYFSQPTVELDIPYCRFVPHVIAARAGQTLIINNQSSVRHSPNWVSRENGEFNPVILPGGRHFVRGLKTERFPIEVGSNSHTWMHAYMRVFDHPYFVVTDDDGKFEIKNAPVLDGKLRMFIWQENGMHRGVQGRYGQTIEVKPGVVDLGAIKFDSGNR